MAHGDNLNNRNGVNHYFALLHALCALHFHMVHNTNDIS